MKAIRALLVTIQVALFGAFFQSTPAHAWGEVGHETIAAIAFNHLNPDVKEKVQNLLGGSDFVTSSIWADQIKYTSAWCHTAPYHFADIPDGSDYFATLKDDSGACNGKPDVVQALLKAETQLASTSSSQADRAAALKFIIHFVGDLHQPLHVGRPEDKGGNEISINWFGKKTNLHAVWDTYLMLSAHHDDFGSMSIPDQAAWYANALDAGHSFQNEAVDPASWLGESIADRSAAYNGYDDESSYQQQNIQLIEQRLRAAGYHLASMLNSVLSDSYQVSSEERALRANIMAICPDFENSIQLSEDSFFSRVKNSVSDLFMKRKTCSDNLDLD